MADDYEHGQGALQLLDSKGIKNTPQWVMVWVIFIMAAFFCGLFFVWNHPIAHWVVGSMFAGMAASMVAISVFNACLCWLILIVWTSLASFKNAPEHLLNLRRRRLDECL